MKTNYTHYIVTGDEEQVFGVSLNFKREVYWIYYPETEDIELFESTADQTFFKSVEGFLEKEKNTIITGGYDYEPKRVAYIGSMIAGNEMLRRQYRGK